jgi:hypothetical protein
MMIKKREGVFRVGVKSQATRLAALKSLGWTWQMIAKLYAADRVLGNARAKDFSREWKLLGGEDLLDDDEVSSLVREVLEDRKRVKNWVDVGVRSESESFVSRGESAGGVKNTESAPVVSAAEAGRLTGTKAAPVVRQEGSVVERHQMSAAAAGVSSKFPTRADGGVAGASSGEWVPSGEPVELSQGSRAELERLMGRGMGMLRSEHFSAYFEFPSDMAAMAPAKVLRQQLVHPTTDNLIGALIFSLGGTERFRGHLARLPGSEKWIGLFKEKKSFQEALEKSRGLSADNKKEDV